MLTFRELAAGMALKSWGSPDSSMGSGQESSRSTSWFRPGMRGGGDVMKSFTTASARQTDVRARG